MTDEPDQHIYFGSSMPPLEGEDAASDQSQQRIDELEAADALAAYEERRKSA